MWLDTLMEMKKSSGKTNKQISQESGIPLGTVNKIFSGPTTDPKLETIRAIVYCLGYTLDDLEPDKINKAPSVSDEAQGLATRINRLDNVAQGAVENLIDYYENVASPAPVKKRTKIIPLLGNSAAAGSPEPDFGNFWTDYEVPEDSPAEFAFKVNGKSMEPYLMDGSIALATKRQPTDGDVAVLIVDGGLLCKQVCQDSEGNLYLFSLNREYPDITIRHNGDQSVMGLGVVIIKNLPPLPEKINL